MIADMVAQIVELRHEFEDLSLAQRDTPKKQQANDVADNMLKGNNVKAVAEPSSAKTQPPALVNIITCRYVDGTVSISSPAGMSTGRFPLPMPAESGDDAAVAEGERGARGSSDRLHQVLHPIGYSKLAQGAATHQVGARAVWGDSGSQGRAD